MIGQAPKATERAGDPDTTLALIERPPTPKTAASVNAPAKTQTRFWRRSLPHTSSRLSQPGW
jgi:hypothetical protein